jgi:ferredoxin
MCEAVDPDRFEVDENGDLVVHSEDVSTDARAAVEEAILACPTAALSLGDD